jgi:hypothetical protein
MEERPLNERGQVDDERPDEVEELGTGDIEHDDGTEPRGDDPEPGVVGGGDQGAHPGALGGEPEPHRPFDDRANS